MKKIIVIKIGSSILMTQWKKLDEFRVAHIADQVAHLKDQGYGVVLIVSGAVASGFNTLKFDKDDQALKQAAAGIGQAILISTFLKIFAVKKQQIAQILLTRENLKDATEDNFKSLIRFYTESGIVPVINENDVISLNSFGGNDNLASKIAALLNAEKLLILSTFDKSFFGVGGSESKLKAIEDAKLCQISARILDGKHRNTILEAVL